MHTCLGQPRQLLLWLVLLAAAVHCVVGSYRHYLSPKSIAITDPGLRCGVGWTSCSSAHSLNDVGPTTTLTPSAPSTVVLAEIHDFPNNDDSLDVDVSVSVFIKLAGGGTPFGGTVSCQLADFSTTYGMTEVEPVPFAASYTEAKFDTAIGDMGIGPAGLSILEASQLEAHFQLETTESSPPSLIVDQITATVTESLLVSVTSLALNTTSGTVVVSGRFSPPNAASAMCLFPVPGLATAATVLESDLAMCLLPPSLNVPGTSVVVEFAHASGDGGTSNAVKLTIPGDGDGGGVPPSSSPAPLPLPVLVALIGIGVLIVAAAGVAAVRFSAATRTGSGAGDMLGVMAMAPASALSYQSTGSSASTATTTTNASGHGAGTSGGRRRKRSRKQSKRSSLTSTATNATIATTGSSVSVYGIADDYGETKDTGRKHPLRL